MKTQKRMAGSSSSVWMVLTISPSRPRDSGDMWWSLKAMSSSTLPVEATPHFSQGQIAPNFVWPQLKQSARVMGASGGMGCMLAGG